MTDLIKRDDALAAIDTALNNATGDLLDLRLWLRADLPAAIREAVLLPCPFCKEGVTSIEGKGQTWRGMGGYSDPQWYQLNHYGKLSETDDFPRCSVEFRCRTEAEAIAAWNTRALPAVTVGGKPLDQFGVRELARAAGISPTTAMRVKRGEGDLDGSTLRAVLAATGTCLCCGKEPQPIDPAAIREAVLRNVLEILEEEGWSGDSYKRIKALIGEKK